MSRRWFPDPDDIMADPDLSGSGYSFPHYLRHAPRRDAIGVPDVSEPHAKVIAAPSDDEIYRHYRLPARLTGWLVGLGIGWLLWGRR